MVSKEMMVKSMKYHGHSNKLTFGRQERSFSVNYHNLNCLNCHVLLCLL